MSGKANNLNSLVRDVRACQQCVSELPHGVRPVIQIDENAVILIAGQAPGARVHETGVPFDDPSGDRLRDWMGIDRATFYDESKVAILPMGFCFPGAGKSGDLAPRKECAPLWREALLSRLPNIQLMLVIGQYAMRWHLPSEKNKGVTGTVENWRTHWPNIIPLPHPSPRNNIWMKKNEWFLRNVVPSLQRRVMNVLDARE